MLLPESPGPGGVRARTPGLLLVVSFLAVLWAITQFAPSRQPMVGEATAAPNPPKPSSGSGTICGELIGMAQGLPGEVPVYFSEGHDPGGIVRSNRPDPQWTLEQSKQARVRYVDLLMTQGAARIQRFHAAAQARVLTDDPDSGYEGLHFGGAGFRPQSVRLTLNKDGVFDAIKLFPRIWEGELLAMAPDALVIRGRRFTPQPVAYGLTFWDPKETRQYHKDYKIETREVRIKTTASTHYTINLDAVSHGSLKAEVGRIMEIRTDCEGRARYVDLFKVDARFNFTGGVETFCFPEGKPRAGAPAPRGRAAFVIGGGDPPKKLLWIAWDAKLYDAHRNQLPFSLWRGPHFGFVGARTDPRTGLATHLFLSETGG